MYRFTCVSCLYLLQGVQGLLPQQDHRHERARVIVFAEASYIVSYTFKYSFMYRHVFIRKHHLQGKQGLLPQQDHRHERARVVVLVEASYIVLYI